MKPSFNRPIRRRACWVGLVASALGANAFAQAAEPAQWQALKQRIRRQHPEVDQVSVPELAAWLRDSRKPQPVLLDVRSADEFEKGHLKGAIRVESERQAQQVLKDLPLDAPVVLYCAVGMRSSNLASQLMKQGRRRVQNLEGSLFEWANADLPMVNAQGPTQQVHPYDRDWGRYLNRQRWSHEPCPLWGC